MAMAPDELRAVDRHAESLAAMKEQKDSEAYANELEALSSIAKNSRTNLGIQQSILDSLAPIRNYFEKQSATGSQQLDLNRKIEQQLTEQTDLAKEEKLEARVKPDRPTEAVGISDLLGSMGTLTKMAGRILSGRFLLQILTGVTASVTGSLMSIYKNKEAWAMLIEEINKLKLVERLGNTISEIAPRIVNGVVKGFVEVAPLVGKAIYDASKGIVRSTVDFLLDSYEEKEIRRQELYEKYKGTPRGILYSPLLRGIHHNPIVKDWIGSKLQFLFEEEPIDPGLPLTPEEIQKRMLQRRDRDIEQFELKKNLSPWLSPWKREGDELPEHFRKLNLGAEPSGELDIEQFELKKNLSPWLSPWKREGDELPEHFRKLNLGAEPSGELDVGAGKINEDSRQEIEELNEVTRRDIEATETLTESNMQLASAFREFVTLIRKGNGTPDISLQSSTPSFASALRLGVV